MALVLLSVIILQICPTTSFWSSTKQSTGTTTHNFQLLQADTRNIILVGKSRTGKSTIIEVLKDANHDPGYFKILRGTVEANINSFTLESSNQQRRSMHFNIMDTPGLFERTSSINNTRTNEIITKMILKCVDMELTKINHVYYVMSIQHGVSIEDVQAFEIFAKLFVGMEDKISILLSFSQSLETEEEYNNYVDQFKEVKDLKPMFEKIGGRIYFLGAAKKNKFVDIAKMRDNVALQREQLILHIIDQEKAYNVKDLQIYQDNLKLIRNLRQNVTACCEKECVDMDALGAFIDHYSHGSEQTNEADCDDHDDSLQKQI